MRIALVSRELHPLGGGGIGQFVASAAALLSESAEVVVLTSSAHEEEYERLREQGDERLPPAGVRVEFAPEPPLHHWGSYFSPAHLYSAAVYERLREIYDEPPDLIEFPDYLAEGFVTIQAAQAHDPFLRDTTLCVRAHTSAEMCAVLNGHLGREFEARATHELERYTLRHADVLIWQGGDILGSYERFYGADALAPDLRVRYPLRPGFEAPTGGSPPTGGELALLYFGRLERRKGVQALIEAITGLHRDDIRLTVVGADTLTGALGTSMRDQLIMSAGEDARIEFRDAVPRDALPSLIASHAAVVLPSRWECWPYAALETLACNRPVIATPTGGFTEMIEPQRSGLITAGTGPLELERAIRELCDDRAWIASAVAERLPAARARELVPEGEIVAAYEELAARPGGGRRRPVVRARTSGDSDEQPLVSAVIPYHGLARHVGETVASLFEQTYPRIEVTIVNDGSFEEEDWLLAQLSAEYPLRVVTTRNSGLGAARNMGVLASAGSYLLPLDADNALAPEFTARCLELLEARPELAYATTWLLYVDEDGNSGTGPDMGWQPLSNDSPLNAETNVAGDAVALIRRRVFERGFAYSEELTSYEDWHLYRELHRAGLAGAVIPERLVRYRVRPDSMTGQIAVRNRDRLVAEIDTLMREREIQWTS